MSDSTRHSEISEYWSDKLSRGNSVQSITLNGAEEEMNSKSIKHSICACGIGFIKRNFFKIAGALLFWIISCIATFTIAYFLHYTENAKYQTAPISIYGTYVVDPLMKSVVMKYNNSLLIWGPWGARYGWTSLLKGSCNFSVSVSLPTDVSDEFQILPLTTIAIGMSYHLDPNITNLNIPQSVLLTFYKSNSFWNNSILQLANNFSLPQKNVIPLHEDTSSTGEYEFPNSDLFFEGLCAFNNTFWGIINCSSNTVIWPVPNPSNYQTIQGDLMMARAISYVPYTLGYLSFHYGFSTLSYAAIENSLEQYVMPTIESIKKAVDFVTFNPNNMVTSLLNLDCDGCYPLSGLSYIIYRKTSLTENCSSAYSLYSFLLWYFSTPDLDELQTGLGYIPFSSNAKSIILSVVTKQYEQCQQSQNFFDIYQFSLLVGSCFTFLIINVIIIARYCRCRESGEPEKKPLLPNQAISEAFAKDSINISDSELIFQKIIGKGAFSAVYSGFWRGTPVAIKKININSVQYTFSSSDFQKEILILSNLRHPSIILFLGASFSNDTIYIVTEYCSKGSLYDVIHSNEDLSFERKLQMAIDAARGMLYLHERTPKIIHRDLKTSNLLVDKDWNVKVADFGLSTVINTRQILFGNIGTVEYMAPECLKNEAYTEKADIYSFGIVLCELFTRQELYKDLTVIQIRFSVRTQNLRPKISQFVPLSLKKLIEFCWHSKPFQRPSMREILATLVSFQEYPSLLHTPPKIESILNDLTDKSPPNINE